MRFLKCHLPGSLRVAAVAAPLMLGGCELLAALDDGAREGANAAAGASAPLPPPPAPRLSRLASRRPAAERASTSDTAAGDAAGEGGGEAMPPALAGATPRPAEAEAPAEPARDPVAPERIVGLSEDALATWLGDPANRREESPARIWRYEGAGCSLDVFLYLDLVSRQFRALSYDIRGSNRDDQRCLHPVFAGRGDPPRTAARRVD